MADTMDWCIPQYFFSEIYAPENLQWCLYASQFLRYGEIAAIFKMAVTYPTGEIWLGTITTFTWFGVMYICSKFHAFTTKCTIHSYLVS